MAGVLTALGSGQAIASNIACGAVITADTTLDSDLVNCPNNGIVIGADNITLDLNGHTIDGDGALVDPCQGEACDLGVDNTAGHDGITIKGGAVRDFATGLFLLGAGDNRLQRLVVSGSFFSGLLVGESTRTRLEQSAITRNGLTTDEAGMVFFASDDSQILGNLVSGNGDIGMVVVGSADGNHILDNTILDHIEAGIAIDGVGNEVRGNRVLRNADGIIIVGNDNTITRNIVREAFGCPDGCGYGISFEGGSNNLIAQNTIAQSIRGIRVDAFAAAAVGTIIRANVVTNISADGIVINLEQAGPVRGTALDRNLVVGARDDGIDVKAPRTTLVAKVAIHNGDLGIEAAPGVTDAGGNRAARNGNPAQCTNVDCRP